MPYEPFEKGVDPGLQAWLRMRLAAREAQLAGGNKTVVIRDVPYKYYKPWIVNFFELPGNEIERIMRKGDREMWNYSASLAKEPPALHPPLTITGILHTNLSSMSVEEMELFVNRIMEDRTVVFLETLLSHPQFSILQRIGSHRQTLLHIACGLGDVDKVMVLLNNQCKVNVADTEGLTPLHYCMHPAEEVMHSEALVQLLLKQKASINICDQRLRSPLHYACILQSGALVLLLLQKGADLAILDSFEKFPLDYLRHGDARSIAVKFFSKPARRGQLVRISARTVATAFVGDVFRVVQPQCVHCRHTLGTCTLNKKNNYRLWLFQHGRIRSEYVGSTLLEAKQKLAAILVQDPPPG